MRVAKNLDAALISLRCSHAPCAHRYMQTGEAYETAETLVCPECGGETRIDVNHLKTIHERQLKLLRQTRERLRTMGI